MSYSGDEQLNSEASHVTNQSSTDDESDSMSDSQGSDESDSSQFVIMRKKGRVTRLLKLKQKMIYSQHTEKSFVKYCLSILSGYMIRKNIFRQIMKTKQDLMDVDGFQEAMEAAIHKRKFILN
ncbi:hypothetical protein AC249_AIPGENE13780 [Exaiptasia diaphana]|nr:hypothetical protein AC249_AIPGENE13780 [Exaiptasia diaphana]